MAGDKLQEENVYRPSRSRVQEATQTGKEVRRQLVSVNIQGLFGEYDHSFHIPIDQEFTILHGPNGVGKTRVLELVNATLDGTLALGRVAHFNSLQLDFDDNSALRVWMSHEDSSMGEYRWFTRAAGGEFCEWETRERSPDLLRQAALVLMDKGLVRRRVRPVAGGSRYFDTRTGEEMTLEELVSRNMAHLPQDFEMVPDEVRTFIESARVSLIEVNRLRGTPSLQEDDVSRLQIGLPVDWIARLSAPARKAEELRSRIMKARVDYAVFAQKQDRTYPERLLKAAAPVSSRERNELERAILGLRAEQQRLEQLSLLDVDSEILSPTESLDGWQLLALDLHVRDAAKKLEVFRELRDKVALFERIINAKVQGKKMSIDAEKGFVFEGKSGQVIPLDGLSSGEQHELILAYRLIFESEFGQMILIDEPEISLHVSWQRQFLGDLQEIAHLNGTRYVVATHSPQIVGPWGERMVRLGGDVE